MPTQAMTEVDCSSSLPTIDAVASVTMFVASGVFMAMKTRCESNPPVGLLPCLGEDIAFTVFGIPAFGFGIVDAASAAYGSVTVASCRDAKRRAINRRVEEEQMWQRDEEAW